MNKFANKKNQKIKICLVTSTGGHFYQTYQLREWWNKYDHFWITFDNYDTKIQLKNEQVYYGYFPENRNIINALKHCLLAVKIFLKERPQIVFSTGAGIAPPFFLIGKLLGIKLFFLETASYIDTPTLSGKLIYRITDRFLIQHKQSRRFYPNSEYHGGLI